MRRSAYVVIAVLIAAAVFPPFVRMAGPLSMDDVLPLAAVGLGLALLLGERSVPSLDVTIIGFVLLVAAGLVSSTFNAGSDVKELMRLSAKSAGRVAFYACLVTVTTCLIRGRNRIQTAALILVGAATLQALFSLVAYAFEYRGPYGIGVQGFSPRSTLAGKVRVQGTFGAELGPFEIAVHSANFLAAYVMMGTLVTGGLALAADRWRSRLLLLGSALAQAATLFLTYTRASLAALGVGILALGWFLDRKRLAAVTLIVGIVAALSIPSVRAKFLDRHDRFSLYWAAAQIVADHPITGVGEGRHEKVLYSSQDYMDTPFGIASSTSHNSVLQSAVHHGIFGGVAHLILYILAALAILRAVRRSEGKDRYLAAGIGAALVAYVCQDQFNNLMYVPKVATQAWFLFGLLIAIGRERETNEAQDRRS